uniref:Leucine rich repeat containing 49 n=1 Tax=Mola mola TaxID=94237 RepID=A0A3Q4BM43_MOLML
MMWYFTYLELCVMSMSGSSGGSKYSAVPGFPFTRLARDRFASLGEGGIHNQITMIWHLSHLQQLVVLNFYDDHISEMTGIETERWMSDTLPPVLFLHLYNMIILVASLHNFMLCMISVSLCFQTDLQDSNVSHLSQLKVLNLAGNSISRVENLQGLDCLTEHNLWHNCISVVIEVDLLPCLQRLFLSCNNIISFDQLACLGELCSLSEVTLDGNPIALETWYKQAVLCCVLHLRQLDMKRVTDEDRRMAGVQARKEEEKKRESHKILLKATNFVHSAYQDPFTKTVLICVSVCTCRLVEIGSGSIQSLSLSDSHLAELDGDTLRLFGLGALEALERGWGVQTAAAVTVITFRYISFDAIIPTLPRIRVKFPNLSHLIFLETNISRLPQLAALAQVRRLEQLTIHTEGNPVVSLALWRSFVIYRLHHFNLKRINGQEVTMNDVIAAERMFGTLGHIAATETPRCRLLLLLEESRKRQLQFLLEGRGRRAGLSPEELRDNGKPLREGLSRALFNYPSRDCSEGSVESSERSAMIDQYLQGLVQQASDTNLKGEALHKIWPSMFAEMVRDSVLEMRDRTAFRQASLAKLSETK